MGCLESREIIILEEKFVSLMEASLNYASHDCKIIDYYHRKYSYKEEINYEQWLEIVHKLGLNVENTRECPRAKDLYESLKNPNGTYNFRKMAELGILLSSGNSIEKARLLFQLFDPLDEKILSAATINQLIDEILEICVGKTTILALNVNSKISQNSVVKYVNILKKNAKKFKPQIINKFIGSDAKNKYEFISLSNFESRIKKSNLENFLTTQGIRQFIFEEKMKSQS
ncbi:unnamed protein product [Blepharisma stoltei]|uniref:Homing endonuclease LAGLIDADG domain-containing protein n=1 Tax=Blepharisma stoltei TaxID=1481888 RepID=A0AAU9K674_9CILI|nr:unnamed protein product [Blepharisma stoltei]